MNSLDVLRHFDSITGAKAWAGMLKRSMPNIEIVDLILMRETQQKILYLSHTHTLSLSLFLGQTNCVGIVVIVLLFVGC